MVQFQINEAKTDAELQALIDGEIEERIFHSGHHQPLSLQTREAALQCIVVHETVLKRKPQLDDMRRGLSSVRTRKQNMIEQLADLPDLLPRLFPRLHIQMAPWST